MTCAEPETFTPVRLTASRPHQLPHLNRTMARPRSDHEVCPQLRPCEPMKVSNVPHQPFMHAVTAEVNISLKLTISKYC